MGVRFNTSAITESSSAVGRELAKPSGGSHGAALRWSARFLVAASWISGAIFAAYIVAFFGGVALGGAGERWNESLPDLYDGGALLSTAAIGAHFMAGAVLLLLGPVQLIGSVRRNVPALHRWLGRIYVASAGLAGAGGLWLHTGERNDRRPADGHRLRHLRCIDGTLRRHGLRSRTVRQLRAAPCLGDQVVRADGRLLAVQNGIRRLVPTERRCRHWTRVHRLVRRDHGVLFLCPQSGRR